MPTRAGRTSVHRADAASARLIDRVPEIDPDELIAGLVPPPRFDSVRFATYVPNPAEPTQARAVQQGHTFAERVGQYRSPGSAGGVARLRSLFGRRGRAGNAPRGLYFDGGFGVGKTHLLASLWHAVPHPKAYATFVELTNLVGVLGYSASVSRLSGHRLVAIDEFELDDPGDTMLVTRLVRELMAAGVHVGATSNTVPDKLGEARFAAEDFLREIRALSDRFDVVRVEGPDYRHRGLAEAPSPVTDEELAASATAWTGSTTDEFTELCRYLSRLHPSQYGRLLDGVSAVHLRGVHAVPDQGVALRLVALTDRLYDRSVPVIASGEPLSAVFTEDMLQGGYRKKYLRAVSRLTALAREAGDSPGAAANS